MVNYRPGVLDATFSALADPTRRAILERLSRSHLTVSELAAPFRISPPAISRHLRVLEGAGLVVRRVEGRTHRIALAPGPLDDARRWIEEHRRFWEGRLDALERFLATPAAEKEASWPHPRPATSRSASSARSTRRASASSPRGPSPRSSSPGSRPARTTKRS